MYKQVISDRGGDVCMCVCVIGHHTNMPCSVCLCVGVEMYCVSVLCLYASVFLCMCDVVCVCGVCKVCWVCGMGWGYVCVCV